MNREELITTMQNLSLILLAAGILFCLLAVMLFFRFRLIEAIRNMIDPDGTKRIHKEERKRKKQEEKKTDVPEKRNFFTVKKPTETVDSEQIEPKGGKVTEVLTENAKGTEVLDVTETEVLHEDERGSEKAEFEEVRNENITNGFEIVGEIIISFEKGEAV